MKKKSQKEYRGQFIKSFHVEALEQFGHQNKL